jgi:hypothetical protein
MVAAALPNVTLVIASRFVPEIVTVVPPTLGPDVELSALIVGGRARPLTAVDTPPEGTVLPTEAGATTYLNLVRNAGDVPPAVSTVTATPDRDTSPAGVVTVMLESVFAVMIPALPPNVTDFALARFRPEIVTVVPPAELPDVGVNAVRLGAATYVYALDKDVDPAAAVRNMDLTPTVPAGAFTRT